MKKAKCIREIVLMLSEVDLDLLDMIHRLLKKSV